MAFKVLIALVSWVRSYITIIFYFVAEFKITILLVKYGLKSLQMFLAKIWLQIFCYNFTAFMTQISIKFKYQINLFLSIKIYRIVLLV